MFLIESRVAHILKSLLANLDLTCTLRSKGSGNKPVTEMDG